ncbi:MAG: hypothetical protein ACLGIA_03280 [Actinomycetes bacterium]
MASPDHERDDDGSVDVEAAWADIIAHWDETGTPPSPRAAEEDVSGRGVGEAENGAVDVPVTPGEETPLPGPGEPVSLPDQAADGQRDDAWDDEWDVPRSHVGGDPVRDAADRDAEIDAMLDEEGYEPPEPPPLPRGDVVSRFAWSGVLGAPLFFLLAALFWHSAPTWLVVGAVAAFVGGFVTLVVRMPDSRDDDDDGAVV